LIEDEAHLGFDIPEAPEIRRIKPINSAAAPRRRDARRTSEQPGGKFERFERGDKSRRLAERSTDQFSRDKKPKRPERHPKYDASKRNARKEYFSLSKTSKPTSNPNGVSKRKKS
jgi:hypothetical protein